jgi:hypothetical protein
MPIVMTSSNPFEATAWERHDVEHVGQFLMQHFKGVWPESARLYDGQIAKSHDVTPTDEATVHKLEELDGPLWCVVYPATGVEVAIGIGVVALIASVAAVLLIPEIPTMKTPQERSQGLEGGSPNNSLNRRTNEARPLQRIPLIMGTVKSIPDAIMVPYTVYVDHIEQEIGYYCIGENEYDIDVENVRDGDSRVDQIPGASAHFYGPGDAPTGVGPFSGTQLAIGDPIEDPVFNVFQVSAVNGQSLEPINSRTIYGAQKRGNLDGEYTDSAAAIDYQNFFFAMSIEYVDATHGIIHAPSLKNRAYVYDRISVGDKLWLYAPLYLASGAPAPNLQSSEASDFANCVTVLSMSDDPVLNRVEIEFSVPAALSAQWALVPAYVAGLIVPQTTPGGFDCPFFEVTPLTNLYVGPFFVDIEHDVGTTAHQVICNFVAPNGLYADDGVVIQVPDCRIAVELAPADLTGTATGPFVSTTADLIGSDVTDGQRAITMRVSTGVIAGGRFLIRARRLTKRLRRVELPSFVETANYAGERAYTGRITDEVRWTHCYSVSKPPNGSFGDVTTVHTKTVATAGAVRIRQRELNVICTRMINTWNGTTFAGPAIANSDAENVLFTLMKSATVGNLPDAQIDFAGIADAFAAIRQYFNDSNTGTLATQVSLTLDDYNISAEETFQAIANLGFCTIYRQGNIIKCNPDMETDIAVAAFNHRNIQPATQKITHKFGKTTENDCVEVEYSDPFNDRLNKVRWPRFGNTVAPRSLRVTGLQSRRHAFWHAARAFMKMSHQRQALQMKTTQEAAPLIARQRIMVADVTRLDRQSGNVVAVSGLNLRLSQPPDLSGPGDYTIFLMHPDGTVEGIPVTGGGGSFDVTLGTAPSNPLITDAGSGVPTIYNIVKDDESMPFAFMVSELSAENNMSFSVSGINYSNMYYLYDGMKLWVQKQFRDEGIYEQTLDPDHTFSTVSDPVRGTMLVADGTNGFTIPPTTLQSDIIDITGDYACACWVRHNSDTGSTELVATTDNTTRFFGFFDNDLAAGHNGGPFEVQAACPVGGDPVHVGVNYRISDGRMGLFINGVLVDVATGVAAPSTPLGLNYMRIFDGRWDNLMVWKRYISDRAMMEICLKTKI